MFLVVLEQPVQCALQVRVCGQLYVLAGMVPAQSLLQVSFDRALLGRKVVRWGRLGGTSANCEWKTAVAALVLEGLSYGVDKVFYYLLLVLGTGEVVVPGATVWLGHCG